MKPQMKILVVDDDAAMLSLLKDFLSTLGYRVDAVSSGAAALPFVLNPDSNTPDLVISDVQMKPMNGIELLRRLKTTHPELPVVMISSFGERDREREVVEMGAKKLLAKPFPLRELALVVEQSLKAAS